MQVSSRVDSYDSNNAALYFTRHGTIARTKNPIVNVQCAGSLNNVWRLVNISFVSSSETTRTKPRWRGTVCRVLRIGWVAFLLGAKGSMVAQAESRYRSYRVPEAAIEKRHPRATQTTMVELI